MKFRLLLGPLAFAVAIAAPLINARDRADQDVIAALDTEYQAAVERNDWQGMDKILHKDFTLILSKGKVVSRAEILEWAREPEVIYEKQVEVPGTQTVRMFGPDTATVTALLWLKGTFTKDKIECANEDGFARACFSGDDIESGLQVERQVGDERKVLDAERGEHGRNSSR